jgi:predicted dehydrogenase
MTRPVLRIGLIGVSHWHLPNYLNGLLALPDVRVAAVSDPDPDVARSVADRLGSRWTADVRELADPREVDFVFALGRHCDMAAQGRTLIEAGLPFAMEKPCGLNLAEVADLEARAATHGAFAAVPFVWRQTEFMDVVRNQLGRERFEYLSLRIVSGHPDRYPRSGNAWMLDPTQSGGGSTINLAVHLIDLYRILAETDQPEVRAAFMSNEAFGLPVEDWSAIVLATPESYCVAETGFLYPAPTGTYDARFTIKTGRHYIMTDPTTTVILDQAGGRVTAETPAANEPTYARFVADVLDRFRRGAPPLAGLQDMRSVMAAISKAYELAGPLPGVTRAPR